MRPGHEEMRGQDLGDHRAHEGQRRQVRATSVAFALQPAVREGGEDDVPLPPRQGAPFEVIEAEFVLQLLILLLDRPPLMGEPDQGAQRRRGGQVDQIVLGPVARAEGAFAQEPHLWRQPTVAPVVRGGDADRTEAGPPDGMRAVAPRHHAPGTCGLRRGPDARLEGGHVGGQSGPRGRAPGAGAWGGRIERGRADEHGEGRRDAQGVRQLRAVQRAPQRRTLAELRIAEHRRHGDPAGADLPQQCERELPLRQAADMRRNAGACPLGGRQPGLGEVQRGAQHPRLGPRPQGPRHGGLAVGDLAERAAVLPRHADRVRALLGKAGAIENEDARAIGNRGAQLPPHGLGRPRRIGNEMLERLIRARIADALEHRTHRLAPTVAQQPEQVATEGAALGDVREAHFERLEPGAQAIEPRRRVGRQSRQHWDAAYRTRRKSTMSSNVITRGFSKESDDLTKSYQKSSYRARQLAERPREQ